MVFRILGLCNNFGYVVMLSAAGHILGEEGTDPGKCNPSSAGVSFVEFMLRLHFALYILAVSGYVRPFQSVLLANILPALVIKVLGPFITLPIQ